MPSKSASLCRQQWRFFWLKLHLYIGLSLGFIFVLAGLTGSLLVFYVEIDELLNPALQIAETPQAPEKSTKIFYKPYAKSILIARKPGD